MQSNNPRWKGNGQFQLCMRMATSGWKTQQIYFDSISDWLWSSVRWLLFVCVTALFVCLLDTSYIYTYIRKEEVYLCSMRLLRRRSRSSNKEHRLTLNEEEEKEEKERRRRNEDKGQRWERKEHPYSGSLITQQQQQRPSPRSDSFLVAPQTINLFFLFNLQDDVGYVTAV